MITLYYEDKRGKWRWRMTSVNGKIVGASSQGFASRTDCIVNLELIQGGRNVAGT